ncbi:MAG: hypothetical protein LBG81_04590 [Coriobacteriaceae bacterium]|nr:hypothetical protein [Coriobacteriaceae bacterium]
MIVACFIETFGSSGFCFFGGTKAFRVMWGLGGFGRFATMLLVSLFAGFTRPVNGLVAFGTTGRAKGSFCGGWYSLKAATGFATFGSSGLRISNFPKRISGACGLLHTGNTGFARVLIGLCSSLRIGRLGGFGNTGLVTAGFANGSSGAIGFLTGSQTTLS